MAPPSPKLADWLAGPLGSLLLREERAAVADSLECAFGLHCLQVGDWGGADAFLGSARTRRSALVATSPVPGAALVADPAALPLQSDSVDVMLLPHTLEFAPDPNAVTVVSVNPAGEQRSWTLAQLIPDGFNGRELP